jgi:hypothetical protein
MTGGKITGRSGSAVAAVGALAAVAALTAASASCGKKASAPSGPPPELTGLAVVPANAQVIVGVNPAKLTDSPVIDRQVEQLLLREPLLAERWHALASDCQIDLVKQVKRVMLALGPNAELGTGPVLMVAVGSIPELDLKQCVVKLVGTGGGTVTGKMVLGRTLYLAKDGNRSMYFAYSRPDTVVLSADEAYITQALGDGKKATDNPDLTAWRKLIDENAPLWAVGHVDPRLRSGLVELTDGKVAVGPAAFALNADLTDGIALQFNAVMDDAAHAKSLESYVKTLMGLLTAAAQLKSLGSVVGKVSVTSDRELVKLRVVLTVNDVNLLLSALDDTRGSEQDRAPPHSGSDSGAKQ